jgi:hypothetical protein
MANPPKGALALPASTEHVLVESVSLLRVSEPSDSPDMIAIFDTVCTIYDLQPVLVDGRFCIPVHDNVNTALSAAGACRKLRERLGYRQASFVANFKKLFEAFSKMDSSGDLRDDAFLEAASLAASEMGALRRRTTQR